MCLLEASTSATSSSRRLTAIASLQGKVTSFATELGATNQKTETRCTNIRKEVSKALSEQRQLLTSQTDVMSKKMESVAAKVPSCVIAHLSLCVASFACLHVCLSICLSAYMSVCLPVCLPACLPACLSISVYLSVWLLGHTEKQNCPLPLPSMMLPLLHGS